jgi:hypothetical protein
VFLVVGRDVRQCLICEGVFTRQAASEHARVVCKQLQPRQRTRGSIRANVVKVDLET